MASSHKHWKDLLSKWEFVMSARLSADAWAKGGNKSCCIELWSKSTPHMAPEGLYNGPTLHPTMQHSLLFDHDLHWLGMHNISRGTWQQGMLCKRGVKGGPTSKHVCKSCAATSLGSPKLAGAHVLNKGVWLSQVFIVHVRFFGLAL